VIHSSWCAAQPDGLRALSMNVKPIRDNFGEVVPLLWYLSAG
jgi:hypothetical protein